MQLKTLNSQIALLIEAHETCTETVRKADELLDSYRANEKDYHQVINNQAQIITNNETQMKNFEGIIKNNKKKARNRIFYFGSGGLAVGLLTGLIIAR